MFGGNRNASKWGGLDPFGLILSLTVATYAGIVLYRDMTAGVAGSSAGGILLPTLAAVGLAGFALLLSTHLYALAKSDLTDGVRGDRGGRRFVIAAIRGLVYLALCLAYLYARPYIMPYVT